MVGEVNGIGLTGDVSSDKENVISFLLSHGISASYVGYSKSNGYSIYFMVGELKVRFSDHSVRNMSRLQEEIHFNTFYRNDSKGMWDLENNINCLKMKSGDDSYVYGKTRNHKGLEVFGYYKNNN